MKHLYFKVYAQTVVVVVVVDCNNFCFTNDLIIVSLYSLHSRFFVKNIQLIIFCEMINCIIAL